MLRTWPLRFGETNWSPHGPVSYRRTWQVSRVPKEWLELYLMEILEKAGMLAPETLKRFYLRDASNRSSTRSAVIMRKVPHTNMTFSKQGDDPRSKERLQRRLRCKGFRSPEPWRHLPRHQSLLQCAMKAAHNMIRAKVVTVMPKKPQEFESKLDGGRPQAIPEKCGMFGVYLEELMVHGARGSAVKFHTRHCKNVPASSSEQREQIDRWANADTKGMRGGDQEKMRSDDEHGELEVKENGEEENSQN